MIEHLLAVLDTFAKESKVDADTRRKRSVMNIQEDQLKEKARGTPKPPVGYRRLLETHNNSPRPQQNAPNLQDYRITRTVTTASKLGTSSNFPHMIIPALPGSGPPNPPDTTGTSPTTTTTTATSIISTSTATSTDSKVSPPAADVVSTDSLPPPTDFPNRARLKIGGNKGSFAKQDKRASVPGSTSSSRASSAGTPSSRASASTTSTTNRKRKSIQTSESPKLKKTSADRSHDTEVGEEEQVGLTNAK